MRFRRLSWLAPLLVVVLASCTSSASGPRAWIDQPLDGSQLPREPLAITAHAADSDGVSTFEFYLNDELVQTIAAQGGRFGEASWEWEPSQPGEFTIRVVPIDSQGNLGQAAQAHVRIAELDQGDLIDLSQAQVQETVKVAIESIECLTGQTVAVDIEISSPVGIESYMVFNTVIQAEYMETFQPPLPITISKTVQVTEPILDPIARYHRWGLKVDTPGEVAPIYAYAVEPNDRCPGHYKYELADEQPSTVDLDQVKARQNATCRQGPEAGFEPAGYLMQDELAAAVGKLANQSWIQVRLPASNQICWIVANLLEFDPGLLDVLPPVAPPPLPVPDISTVTPILDTTSPVIAGVGVNPALILTQGSGCSAYSRTTAVQATVTDNVGVDLVNANWSVGGESGQVTLVHVTGDIFEGVVGPVNTTGTLNISVWARDEAGNSNSASAPGVTVQNCIE
ncbi:MAG: hypothetical protein E4G99_11675 [Anaerolineales bacterium]|nr:MAG: hypothetical protein E4G99_11675 [Anaerolineales bacterium]